MHAILLSATMFVGQPPAAKSDVADAADHVARRLHGAYLAGKIDSRMTEEQVGRLLGPYESSSFEFDRRVLIYPKHGLVVAWISPGYVYAPGERFATLFPKTAAMLRKTPVSRAMIDYTYIPPSKLESVTWTGFLR